MTSVNHCAYFTNNLLISFHKIRLFSLLWINICSLQFQLTENDWLLIFIILKYQLNQRLNKQQPIEWQQIRFWTSFRWIINYPTKGFRLSFQDFHIQRNQLNEKSKWTQIKWLIAKSFFCFLIESKS